MTDNALATVVIPVWRDAAHLRRTLGALPPHPAFDVVVSTVLGDDVQVDDDVPRRADLRWVDGPRGRGVQMNAGAALARGRWLVFLHADSKLPADWMDVIRRVEARADIVGGSFRLALESLDWRARIIEWGVRARVGLLGMPYGDQAIFVRRDVFTALNGYRDLPLMEDVEFVRRLKRVGRLWHSASPVRTSARRWHRDGWIRRSAGNVALTCRFLFGAAPERLAQSYHQRAVSAVLIMARAPWTEGKTRLSAGLDPADHEALREALFGDTLSAATSVGGVSHIIACEPAAAVPAMRARVGSAVDVIAQHGGDLGERMVNAFKDTFRLGVESAVMIGSDLPDLPARLIGDAFTALASNRARVVVGPSGDGGYYLIGMSRRHPGLFAEVDWGTGQVLEQTLRNAARLKVPIVQLEAWSDVDQPADLERLRAGSADGGAVLTRQWLSAHLDTPPTTG